VSHSARGLVLQGYFRIREARRGSSVTARPPALLGARRPTGIAQASAAPDPGVPRPDLLPAAMRLARIAQPRPAPALDRALRLPGMGRLRPGLASVAQPMRGDAVSTTPLPDAQLRLIGSGTPIDPGARRAIESFFGEDFSGVRVYQGAAAPSIGALAFTLGEAIYFAPGLYDPHSRDGIELLGHELTHVVQQREGRVHNPYRDGIAIVQDPALETEADLVGRQLAEALWSRPGTAPAAARHRPRFPSTPAQPKRIDSPVRASSALRPRAATSPAAGGRAPPGVHPDPRIAQPRSAWPGLPQRAAGLARRVAQRMESSGGSGDPPFNPFGNNPFNNNPFSNNPFGNNPFNNNPFGQGTSTPGPMAPDQLVNYRPRVVEVGCGDGGLAGYLRGLIDPGTLATNDFVATDAVSPTGHSDVCSFSIAAGVPSFHSVSANALENYFRPESIEIIISANPFGYGLSLEDDRNYYSSAHHDWRFLRSAMQVLRPGGCIIMLVQSNLVYDYLDHVAHSGVDIAEALQGLYDHNTSVFGTDVVAGGQRGGRGRGRGRGHRGRGRGTFDVDRSGKSRLGKLTVSNRYGPRGFTHLLDICATPFQCPSGACVFTPMFQLVAPPQGVTFRAFDDERATRADIRGFNVQLVLIKNWFDEDFPPVPVFGGFPHYELLTRYLLPHGWSPRPLDWDDSDIEWDERKKLEEK
jgi:SAM-dependent methyltransferase